MPRISVKLPVELLKVASARAEELGKSRDDLAAEAIERYIEATKSSSPGSVRSRFMILRSTPESEIEIPEELFQRGEVAAKRQGKRRSTLYADALAYHLAAGASAHSALDQGHDLPSGAWRPKGSS